MKQTITVTMTTSASTEDVFSALALLNPEDLSLSTKPGANGGKTERKSTRPFADGKISRPPSYTDGRIIWNAAKGRIDVLASLRALNTTGDQLRAIVTKHDTAEYAVKMAMQRQGIKG